MSELDFRLEGLRKLVAMKHSLPSPERRREIRLAAGVSSEELAEVVGVSSAALRTWETGKRAPRLRNLARYAEALAVLEEGVQVLYDVADRELVPLDDVDADASEGGLVLVHPDYRATYTGKFR